MEKTELEPTENNFNELSGRMKKDIENGAFFAARHKIWDLLKIAPDEKKAELYKDRAICNFHVRDSLKGMKGYNFALEDVDKACELDPENYEYMFLSIDFRLKFLFELETEKNWNKVELKKNLDRTDELISQSGGFSQFNESQKERKAIIKKKIGWKKWVAQRAFELADNLINQKGESAELLYAKGVASYHLRCNPIFDGMAADCFERAIELDINTPNEYACPMFGRMHQNFVLKNLHSADSSNSTEVV